MSISAFRTLAFAALVCLMATNAAIAGLHFSTRQADNGLYVVLVQGNFAYDDDLDAFSTQVRAHPQAIVTFDSPGGNIVKAMELGRLIRSYGLSTVQIRGLECESACSLAFMGGVFRSAEPGSIGVHRSSFVPGSGLAAADAVSVVQQITANIMSYMSEMGVDPSLLQLALQYDSTDIRYLSGSEMAKYRVTTTAPQSSDPTASTPLPNAAAGPSTQSGTPTAPGGTSELPPALKEQAIGFVESLINVHTRAAAYALDQVTHLYAATVNYYGRQLSLTDVLKDKTAYFRRWPERGYHVRPESISATCAGSVCTVTGIYDWWVRSLPRNKQASGVASFRYLLDVGGGSEKDFRVIGESGEVLSR